MEFIDKLRTALSINFPALNLTESDFTEEISSVKKVCGTPVFQLLEESCQNLVCSKTDLALSVSQVVVDISWENINTGYWKDVAVEWRKMYSYAATVKSLTLVSVGRLEEAVKSCDLGLLLGCPVMDNILPIIVSHIQKNLLKSDNVAQLCSHTKQEDFDQSHHPFPELEPHQSSNNKTLHPPNKKAKSSNNTAVNKNCIKKLKCPSLKTFQDEFMEKEQPIILEGVMDHWPAMSSRRWSFSYLKDIAGFRTVPVEIGSRYTDESWTQKLMTINEFVNGYVLKWHDETDSDKKAYLAQHQLFNQIPELASDICIPDYCCLGDENGDDVIINAWFGPKGTVSPLHHDPYHNLLAQVVGEKYLRIYSWSETDRLYSHDSFLLSNTSQVDVERPDLNKFPMFSDAVYQECILKAGEMLYIPRKHWHFVKSLSVSFSVSFWWS